MSTGTQADTTFNWFFSLLHKSNKTHSQFLPVPLHRYSIHDIVSLYPRLNLSKSCSIGNLSPYRPSHLLRRIYHSVDEGGSALALNMLLSSWLAVLSSHVAIGLRLSELLKSTMCFFRMNCWIGLVMRGENERDSINERRLWWTRS